MDLNILNRSNINTVNADIFAWIHFRGFTKIGFLACIKIRVLSINGSLGYHLSNVHGVHMSQIFKKRELRKNIYSAKISTLKVGSLGFPMCFICFQIVIWGYWE